MAWEAGWARPAAAEQAPGRPAEEEGAPPEVDLQAERRTAEYVRGRIESGCLTAVHDVADGGVAVALAEMALSSRIATIQYTV